MTSFPDPRHGYCRSVERPVSLDQTEGQCREAHHCVDMARCPLEGDFGPSRFRQVLDALGASIGQNWAK